MTKSIQLMLAQAAIAAAGAACLLPWVTAADPSPISRDCATPEHRQLDFWIGDWDTFESDTAGSAPIARARIEPIAGGCALRER